tara:strand:+ start:155 stop:871 length:717 start_codon:yes stop_codon:yes gene_type:complete
MNRLLLIAGIVMMGTGLPAIAEESTPEAQGSRGFGQREGFETFGEAHRFIFLAVLEGLYEDGVSRDDVARMLKQEEGQYFDHFIAHCPLCTAVIQALEVYAARPDFYMYKGRNYQIEEATFGPGLSDKVRADLGSDEVEVRLTAIFGLLSKWMNVRMGRVYPSEKARAPLLAQLELGKKEGLRMLEQFRRDPARLKMLAPGFANIEHCAACSAAVGDPFQEMVPIGTAEKKSTGLLKK